MKLSAMKNFTSITINTCLFLLITLAQTVRAQDTEKVEDKTASPYFFVKSEDGAVDQLPLKQTSADVKISGVIADVTVKQMYCNVGQETLEAIYIFPASTKAAVYYMQMELGGRILKAEIRESEQARQDYEEAKNEGKTTSLLEQKRPNIFQMNVANILPGDTIVVEMRYTELLTPVEGIYEFVYPTVVGPRYAELSTEGDSSWVEVPYTHEGEEPLYNFDIDVEVNAGMEIQKITSPSHASAQFSHISANSVVCELPDDESKIGNKDFVLQYALSGENLETGILLYEGEEENFFLTMVQPPKAPLPTDIPPREYVFIMDVSGSMNGFPIGVSKALLTDLISNLNPSDKFNVICFAGGAQVMSDFSLDATQENIEKAIKTIDNKEGRGGTNMLIALNKALVLPGTENYARTFVIVTDGYVTVEREAFDLIRNKLSEANFFAFGIGNSVNRYLIEGIAHVGMGEPFIVLNEDEAPKNAEKFRKYIEKPVLTNIEIDFGNFEVYDVEPLKVPDVFAERPVITFGKWNGIPQGTISITGLNGNHSYHNEIQVSNYYASPENSALKYLWARYVVQRLNDYGMADNYGEDDGHLKEIITGLGLKYSLLTRYTSFIAIDSLVRNNGDSVTTVTQPLPLPAGVSDFAVGGSYPLGFGAPATTYAMESVGKSRAEKPHSYIDKIYPNPVISKFKVWIHIDEKDKTSDKKLYLFDLTGHVLKIINIENTKDSYLSVKINLEETGYFSPGVYKIALLLNGNAISSKNIFVTS